MTQTPPLAKAQTALGKQINVLWKRSVSVPLPKFYEILLPPGAVLRWDRGGGTSPPNVGQPPPNILVPTAKIRILKI